MALEASHGVFELVRDRSRKADFPQQVVNGAIPASRAILADLESVPDAVRLDGTRQIRENRVGIVQLVRRAHPARSLTRCHETLQVILLSLFARQLIAVRVVISMR